MDANRIPVAVDAETGELVYLKLLHSSVLVGGSSRGGKSVFLQSLLASASYIPNCALCVIDLKRVDFSAFSPRLSVLCKSLSTAEQFLKFAVDEMNRRYTEMERLRLSKLETFSQDLPFIVIVIDELSFLLGADDKSLRESIAASITTLQQTGMASGITLIAATQKPSADALGKGSTTFRDNFQQRVAFKTMTAEQSKTIGVPGEKAKPEEIPPWAKGYCWISSECEDEPLLAKSLYITHDEIADVVASTAHLSVPLNLSFLPSAGAE